MAAKLKSILKYLIKNFFYFLIYISGVAHFYLFLTRGRPRLLCYHYVNPTLSPNRELAVTPKQFEKQLHWLTKRFRFISLEQLKDTYPRKKQPLIAITFDDGSRDLLTYALPLLKKYKIPATVFLTVNFLKKKSLTFPCFNQPGLGINDIPLLLQQGINIGSHSLTHRNLALLSLTELKDEIQESKNWLTQTFSCPLTSFAYPFGSYPKSSQTFTLLKEAGYHSAVTIQDGLVTKQNNPFLLPRLVVNNQPLFAFKVRVSGIHFLGKKIIKFLTSKSLNSEASALRT